MRLKTLKITYSECKEKSTYLSLIKYVLDC